MDSPEKFRISKIIHKNYWALRIPRGFGPDRYIKCRSWSDAISSMYWLILLYEVPTAAREAK